MNLSHLASIFVLVLLKCVKKDQLVKHFELRQSNASWFFLDVTQWSLPKFQVAGGMRDGWIHLIPIQIIPNEDGVTQVKCWIMYIPHYWEPP